MRYIDICFLSLIFFFFLSGFKIFSLNQYNIMQYLRIEQSLFSNSSDIS